MAQVILAWLYQLGVPTNPRSYNASHLAENLAAYDGALVLSNDEVAALSSRGTDTCRCGACVAACVPGCVCAAT